jgi:uncharacterized membrane protein HdeD (DUF308 family)
VIILTGDQWFVLIFIFILGAVFLIGGLFFYNKKEHEKQDYEKRFKKDNFRLMNAIINPIIGKVLGRLPWWTMKVLIILIGVVLIVLGVILIVNL